MAYVVVVAYDIADDRRRLDVADRLALCGARVQLSVFECELAERGHIDQLISDLATMIDRDEDQVRLYSLGERGEATSVLGFRHIDERRAFWIL